jgi:hypothetical protein
VHRLYANTMPDGTGAPADLGIHEGPGINPLRTLRKDCISALVSENLDSRQAKHTLLFWS